MLAIADAQTILVFHETSLLAFPAHGVPSVRNLQSAERAAWAALPAMPPPLVPGAGGQQAGVMASRIQKTRHVARLLALLNGLRRSIGAPVLRLNAELTAAAQSHVIFFVLHGYPLDPHDIGGQTWVHRIESFGYTTWTTLGENVAVNYGYRNPTDELNSQWVNSPPHYANMTDPAFRDVGIATATIDGRTYGCVDFGRAL